MNTLSPAVLPVTIQRTGAPLTGSCGTVVMGILNATPDSFSDGGQLTTPEEGVAQALQMLTIGADIIDIGGESTRPGSQPIPAEEQIRRTVPIITALRAATEAPISIDTVLHEVAAAALDAGADIINDISALRGDSGMAPLAAERGVPVILMHMQGLPRTMQQNPTYKDVVNEVITFLAAQGDAAVAAGIRSEQIIFDPGFGFGKSVEHNLSLLANLEQLVSLGRPVLAGFSRKSTIGAVLDLPVDRRLPGSLATAVIARMRGADILRVHDVAETVAALSMTNAVLHHVSLG
jgi:dihydropteroate synthase